MTVGMPKVFELEEFGEVIFEVFGHIPYHVGSSLKQKTGWRDVDIRLIIPDDEYKAMKFGSPDRYLTNRRWRGLVRAFSILGQHMTGLPIDFQIQQMSYANTLFPLNNNPRSALYKLVDVETELENQNKENQND